MSVRMYVCVYVTCDVCCYCKKMRITIFVCTCAQTKSFAKIMKQLTFLVFRPCIYNVSTYMLL